MEGYLLSNCCRTPLGGGIVIITTGSGSCHHHSHHPYFINEETEAEWLRDLVKVAQPGSMRVGTQTQG